MLLSRRTASVLVLYEVEKRGSPGQTRRHVQAPPTLATNLANRTRQQPWRSRSGQIARAQGRQEVSSCERSMVKPPGVTWRYLSLQSRFRLRILTFGLAPVGSGPPTIRPTDGASATLVRCQVSQLYTSLTATRYERWTGLCLHAQSSATEALIDQGISEHHRFCLIPRDKTPTSTA